MEHNPRNLSEFAQECLNAVSPLGTILHRAMEPSIEEARAFFSKRRFDAYVFADLCRYFTCCRLESTYLPDGITFERLRNNGMLIDCHGRTVRIWKADEDGELQGPGNSKAKREYFDQPFLSLFAPDPAAVKLATVWDYDFKTGILRLSLACPKSFDTFKPWQNPDCHFYLEFPHAATDVKPSPRFQEPPAFFEDIDLKPKRKAEDVGPDEGQEDD